MHVHRPRQVLGAFYLSMSAMEAGDTQRAVDVLWPALEQFEQDDGFARENTWVLDNLIGALEDFETTPGKHLPAVRVMLDRALAVRLRIIDVPL